MGEIGTGGVGVDSRFLRYESVSVYTRLCTHAQCPLGVHVCL